MKEQQLNSINKYSDKINNFDFLYFSQN